MTFFYENLYEDVIKKNAISSSKLIIISGYASASFLKKVLADFPNLAIDLYIGMSVFGVWKEYHSEYLSIMQAYPSVKIYYQYHGEPTHMKVYLWSKDEQHLATYVGSANFTSNGFINWREVLVSCNNNMLRLLVAQKKLSILATDATNEIKFLDEPNFDEVDKQIASSNVENEVELVHDAKALEKRNTTVTKKSSIRRDNLKDEMKAFDVPLLTGGNLTKIRGINAPEVGKPPVLIESNTESFINYLDAGIWFKVEDDRGEILHAKIDNRRLDEMVFKEEIDLYFRKRLSIKEKRAITKADLIKYGREIIFFDIIKNDTEVSLFMDFSPMD